MPTVSPILWEVLPLSLSQPRNVRAGSMVLGVLTKSSGTLGSRPKSCRFECLSSDANPKPSLDPQASLHLFMCLLITLPPPKGGKVRRWGRVLGICIFIFCYPSQIYQWKEAWGVPYHTVLELLTTILFLARKKAPFGRNKARHSHSTFLLLKKAVEFCACYFTL